ncbi:hypothetical protein NC652_038274 [Populus alba x Populus x berolinensis]|uniref:Uncharacterized protein n=1 Tax=Populus alba x Populus x berolinensis TaxID=444605 RepID=A0AAD6PTY3_9ROSI|nr:hypothetical protein NC652_038274 [Populus alba x Populus x berolinensis]KAJ6960189.1 hypothetical protein NC653_038276 [Populus alba x Populus x berolinensis]
MHVPLPDRLQTRGSCTERSTTTTTTLFCPHEMKVVRSSLSLSSQPSFDPHIPHPLTLMRY